MESTPRDLSPQLRQEFEKKLRDDKVGTVGFISGLACLIVLYSLLGVIPGLQTLRDNHAWPIVVLVLISIVVGSIADMTRMEFVDARIRDYPDDVLRHEYEKLREKKMRGYVLWAIIITAVILYLLLK